MRVARTAFAAACLATLAIPAQACRVDRPPPKLEQVAAAVEPKQGFVGRVVATYETEATKERGEAIVKIEITKDFSGKLPPVIYVLNPGCCVCVGIGGAPGEQVMSIVQRGEDGLFQLAY
jgi:hypothetical protein